MSNDESEERKTQKSVLLNTFIEDSQTKARDGEKKNVQDPGVFRDLDFKVERAKRGNAVRWGVFQTRSQEYSNAHLDVRIDVQVALTRAIDHHSQKNSNRWMETTPKYAKDDALAELYRPKPPTKLDKRLEALVKITRSSSLF
jgi:hypothetical protein